MKNHKEKLSAGQVWCAAEYRRMQRERIKFEVRGQWVWKQLMMLAILEQASIIQGEGE